MKLPTSCPTYAERSGLTTEMEQGQHVHPGRQQDKRRCKWGAVE